MEQKLSKKMMEKVIAAESAAELTAVMKEIGLEFSEKDANGLFELLHTHTGEITAEDLLKKFESIMAKDQILGQKLDDDELDTISGGRVRFSQRTFENECTTSIAPGKGGCTWSYIIEQCSDTVEERSSCWSGDYCPTIGTSYTERVIHYYIEPA